MCSGLALHLHKHAVLVLVRERAKCPPAACAGCRPNLDETHSQHQPQGSLSPTHPLPAAAGVRAGGGRVHGRRCAVLPLHGAGGVRGRRALPGAPAMPCLLCMICTLAPFLGCTKSVQIA